MEHQEGYHRIISERLKQRIGQLLFGHADITPTEYDPKPVAQRLQTDIEVLKSNPEQAAYKGLQEKEL